MDGGDDQKLAAARERRIYLLAGLGLLCAMLLLAKVHIFTVTQQYGPADLPGVVIDVNRADADTLAQLEQIGPERARKIVEYREAHGPFQGFPDLMQVEGIGHKTVEALVGKVSFEPR